MKGRTPRGAVIVLVLLMIASLFVLSSSFLTQKTNESQATHLLLQGQQARELAYSGLETVKQKLRYDTNFPPSRMLPKQEIFSYAEKVVGPDGEVGAYTVECDRNWVTPPYSRLVVVIVGQVGDAANPVRHRIVAHFSLIEGRRGDLLNLLDGETL